MATLGLRKAKILPFRLSAADRKMLDLGRTDVRGWAKWYFDVDLRPWQEFFLLAPQRDKLAVAGIRAGKSFISSLGFLWIGQQYPGSRLLNTSISAEQANIVYYNCLQFCKASRFEHWVEKDERHPYPMIRLVNGTELWFRSIGYEAELVRGFEFDLINIDEAAYVVREMAINTLKGRLLGLNPVTRLPRLGYFWQVSTPKGKGHLYERWKRGDPKFPDAEPAKYLSIRARTYDNFDLMQSEAGRAVIADLEKDYTPRLIRQELEGEFIEDDGTVFAYDQLMFACNDVHPEVRWLNTKIAEWKTQTKVPDTVILLHQAEDLDHYELDPESGHLYLQSWDLGKRPTRSGRNAMVGQVWDVTEKPFKLVGWRYAPGASYGMAHEWVKTWHAKYNSNGAMAESLIDATGKGDVVNERLEEEERIEVEGIVYSSAQKPALVHAAQLAVERGIVRFPFIKRFVDQMHNYEIFDKEIPQDIVMSFAQAMYWARRKFGDSTESKVVQKAIISSARRPDASLDRYQERRRAARTGRRR